jgi:hypothetical protein
MVGQRRCPFSIFGIHHEVTASVIFSLSVWRCCAASDTIKDVGEVIPKKDVAWLESSSEASCPLAIDVATPVYLELQHMHPSMSLVPASPVHVAFHGCRELKEFTFHNSVDAPHALFFFVEGARGGCVVVEWISLIDIQLAVTKEVILRRQWARAHRVLV